MQGTVRKSQINYNFERFSSRNHLLFIKNLAAQLAKLLRGVFTLTGFWISFTWPKALTCDQERPIKQISRTTMEPKHIPVEGQDLRAALKNLWMGWWWWYWLFNWACCGQEMMSSSHLMSTYKTSPLIQCHHYAIYKQHNRNAATILQPYSCNVYFVILVCFSSFIS